jgi:hypothetical protein
MTSKLKPRRHWDRYQHYADSRSHFKKKFSNQDFRTRKRRMRGNRVLARALRERQRPL